jgi:pteridine reductase
LLAAGYEIGLHYRHSAAAARALAAELEQQRADSVVLLPADLAELAALPGLIDAVIARFGRLDGLVNNAATYHATPLGSVTAADWDGLFHTNARAPLFLAQAAAEHLRASRGAIVNIADIYAERPLPGHIAYCMSKAAVVMLTRALAQELGPQVRVNAIAPGNVLWSTNPVKAETTQMVEERTTLARQGTPGEIAAAVLYLLRDASYCSGAVLPVDGGRLLHI